MGHITQYKNKSGVWTYRCVVLAQVSITRATSTMVERSLRKIKITQFLLLGKTKELTDMHITRGGSPTWPEDNGCFFNIAKDPYGAKMML